MVHEVFGTLTQELLQIYLRVLNYLPTSISQWGEHQIAAQINNESMVRAAPQAHYLLPTEIAFSQWQVVTIISHARCSW